MKSAICDLDMIVGTTSRPTGARGLKCSQIKNAPWWDQVASHRGAWIEIINDWFHGKDNAIVASHRGAWIEIIVEILKTFL